MKAKFLIPQQVPEFVRAEYPAFIEFLKAYYEWVEEQYALGKLEDLVDIDDTLDKFIQHFRKQLDVYNITATTDNRLFLRHIKELYNAKGSTASFDFLFKILFDKPSTIIQPWDYVFKPSNGNWVQDTSILFRATQGNPNTLVGNPVNIIDSKGQNYRVFVNNIRPRAEGVFELFVTRFTPAAKLVRVEAAESLGGAVRGDILNTTVKVNVEQGGKGFRVGQVFLIKSQGGNGTLCKIKSTNSVGGIVSAEIISFGIGYQTDFNALISPTDEIDPASLTSRIQLNSLVYFSDDYIDPQNEDGSIVFHNYTNVQNSPNQYMQDLTYVGETVAEIQSQEGTVYTTGDYASLIFRVGQFCIYPGYYKDSNNIIGDLVYVQDSYYYQVYSYVTALEESLDKYKNVLRKVLHPTGTKHFAIHQLNNEFTLDLNIDPTLNIIIKEDALRDFVNVSSDDISFKIVAKTFNEPVNVQDNISFLFDSYKYIDEPVVVENGTSGLYMGPFYVDQDPAYWQAGYYENEQEITN